MLLILAGTGIYGTFLRSSQKYLEHHVTNGEISATVKCNEYAEPTDLQSLHSTIHE